MKLTILGLISCVVYSVITWISFAFIYGQGHSQRPILSFLLLYACAFVLYVLAWWQLPRTTYDNRCLWVVLGFAALFRVILLLSNPIQEDDFYRYLWDGKVVASGLNPYRVAPAEVQRATEDTPSLQPYVDILQQDPSFQLILSRVNHPEVPTIYPPLAQGVFALTALIAPGSLTALRVMLLAFDLALCVLLIVLLNQLRMPRVYVLLYAWSPVVIKETINSAHYDVLPAFCLLAAVVCAVSGRVLLAHISLALAILGKIYPLLVLPLLVWRTHQTAGWSYALGGLLITLSLVGLGYVPFWDVGSALWQGTLTFTEQWQTNSFFFPFLWQIVGARWLANGIVVLLLGSLMVGVMYHFPLRDERAFLWGIFLCVFALFLLSPVGNPWYFLWLVPFFCVFPLRSGLLLSGLLGLYYLYFYFRYQQSVETFQWVLWFEYVPFYVVLLGEWGKGEMEKWRNGIKGKG